MHLFSILIIMFISEDTTTTLDKGQSMKELRERRRESEGS